MATLLPPLVELPPAIRRRHQPKPGAYTKYRNCLRWEFQFSCAYCRCHEADLIEHGAEGTALFWVEHYQLKSKVEHLRDAYSNCIYSCRYCNRARGEEPVLDAKGVRLLNPSEDAWSVHFKLQDDDLKPAVGDERAKRTEAVYRVNAPRNIASRRHRRELVNDRIQILRNAPAKISALRDILVRANEEDKLIIQQEIEGWRIARVKAGRDLQRYLEI